MRRAVAVLGLAAAYVLLAAAPAGAHPLGNFSVNHYAGLAVGVDRTTVDVVVDRAEIPTFQQRATVDVDGNGTTSAGEAAGYASRECAAVRDTAGLTLGGVAVRLVVTAANATFPPGQAGLATTRITCTITATYDRLGGETAVAWTMAADRGRVGWREVVATGDGTTLVRSDVPTASRSARLTRYPDDLLGNPLDVTAAHLVVRPGGPRAATAALPTTHGLLPRGVDAATAAFQRAVARDHLTFPYALAALAVSVVLGAVHALAPGHGKTVMAAYLAGSAENSFRQTVIVGATVTATHTAGVVVLGVVLSASSAFAPDRVFPWLGTASGLLLAVLGIGLLRRARRGRPHHHHGHGHDHSGHDHHGHDQPPATTRGLVAMGFAGGLVPSPSALVVLLGAIALGRTWFGVALVLGYGLGMAATLTATGLLLVRARRSLDRRTVRFARALPTVTAAVVVVVGLSLTARGATALLTG